MSFGTYFSNILSEMRAAPFSTKLFITFSALFLGIILLTSLPLRAVL